MYFDIFVFVFIFHLFFFVLKILAKVFSFLSQSNNISCYLIYSRNPIIESAIDK